MADLKKLTDDVATRAAIDAGKQAARKALDGILPPDEDAPLAGKDLPKSSRKWWIIASVVAAVLVVIGVIGLVMAYWQWFLVAGVVALAGLYGYSRLRRRRAGSRKEASAKKTTVAPESKREKEAVSKPRIAEDDSSRAATKQRLADEERLRQLEAERERAVEREARAERESEVDAELAAMKARIKRES